MQPISVLLAFLLGSLTLLSVTCALSIHANQEAHAQQHDAQPAMADLRLRRSLANKRFYDFGSRSINHNNEDDADADDLNDEFNRLRRFYDFGSKKRLATRFYDFGAKKRSDE